MANSVQPSYGAESLRKAEKFPIKDGSARQPRTRRADSVY